MRVHKHSVPSRTVGHCEWSIGLVSVAAVLMIAGIFMAGPVEGQTAPDQVESLLAELGERFEVEVLASSFLLKARSSDDQVEIVQVSPRSILVDLERLSRSESRRRLGDHADLISELAERGFSEPPAAGPEAVVEAEDPPESEVSDDSEDRSESARELRDRRRENRRERSRSRGLVRSDTRMSFGSGLTIEENESAKDVVVLGGPLEIDGEVRGDAVVVGGSARIAGEINGTLTTVGGFVSVEEEGRIYGDIVSVGGTVDIDPRARVTGEVTELAFAPLMSWGNWNFGHWRSYQNWPFDHFYWPFGDLLDAVGNVVVLAIFVMLAVLVARSWVDRSASRVVAEPWKAGLVGVLAQVLFVPLLIVACVVLLLSIIGIPLAFLMIPISVLGILTISLVGFSGVAKCLGHRLEERFDWSPSSPYVTACLGLLVIQGWTIIGESLSFLGGPIRLTAILLLILGFVVKYLAWTVGLGAALMARFSTPRQPPVVPAAVGRSSGFSGRESRSESADPNDDSFTGLGGGFDPLAEVRSKELDEPVDEVPSEEVPSETELGSEAETPEPAAEDRELVEEDSEAGDADSDRSTRGR